MSACPVSRFDKLETGLQPKRSFHEHIKRLRLQNNIPIVWSAARIRPLLKGLFSDNTIGVFPNNYSMSPDGRIKGDAVKRGMKPKYYRLGREGFILVEEYDAWRAGGGPHIEFPEDVRSINNSANSQNKNERDSYANDDPKRPRIIQNRLLEAFPTKPVLAGYAKNCVQEYRTQSASSSLYQDVINRHRLCPLTRLVEDIEFHALVYKTLISWDMNYRRAKLVTFSDFSTSIRAASKSLLGLMPFSMEMLKQEGIEFVGPRLSELFRHLRVMQSRSQIVGVSKTLHFFLPRLVMPVDRKYTLNFLFGNNAYQPTLDAEARLFMDIFYGFRALTVRLALSGDDLMEATWNTTVPKLIDNAIIGYMRDRKRR